MGEDAHPQATAQGQNHPPPGTWCHRPEKNLPPPPTPSHHPGENLPPPPTSGHRPGENLPPPPTPGHRPGENLSPPPTPTPPPRRKPPTSTYTKATTQEKTSHLHLHQGHHPGENLPPPPTPRPPPRRKPLTSTYTKATAQEKTSYHLHQATAQGKSIRKSMTGLTPWATMGIAEQRNTRITLLFKVQPNPLGLQAQARVVPITQTQRVWDATISKLPAMLSVATPLEGTATA